MVSIGQSHQNKDLMLIKIREELIVDHASVPAGVQ
jgi:hypothetical protein